MIPKAIRRTARLPNAHATTVHDPIRAIYFAPTGDAGRWTLDLSDLLPRPAEGDFRTRCAAWRRTLGPGEKLWIVFREPGDLVCWHGAAIRIEHGNACTFHTITAAETPVQITQTDAYHLVIYRAIDCQRTTAGDAA